MKRKHGNARLVVKCGVPWKHPDEVSICAVRKRKFPRLVCRCLLISVDEREIVYTFQEVSIEYDVMSRE